MASWNRIYNAPLRYFSRNLTAWSWKTIQLVLNMWDSYAIQQGIAMGKRGPKPKFNDVACPNTKCSCYGVAGKGNVTSNGTSKIKSGGRVRKLVVCRVFCKISGPLSTPIHSTIIDKYFLPVIHSSLISTRMVTPSLRSAPSFGNAPTTLLLLLSSLLIRSSPLVVLIFFQCSLGNALWFQMSWLNRSMVSADFEHLFWMSSAANSAIFAWSSNPCLSFSATSSLSLFGILFNTARLKWTWHICQVAPKNLDETALCIPLWPSGSWVTNQLVFCDRETLGDAPWTIRDLWARHALQDNCRMFCQSPLYISEIDAFCKNYSTQYKVSSGYPILLSFWRIQWSSLKCDCYPVLKWDFAFRCSWLRSTWDLYHFQKRSS